MYVIAIQSSQCNGLSTILKMETISAGHKNGNQTVFLHTKRHVLSKWYIILFELLYTNISSPSIRVLCFVLYSQSPVSVGWSDRSLLCNNNRFFPQSGFARTTSHARSEIIHPSLSAVYGTYFMNDNHWHRKLVAFTRKPI